MEILSEKDLLGSVLHLHMASDVQRFQSLLEPILSTEIKTPIGLPYRGSRLI